MPATILNSLKTMVFIQAAIIVLVPLGLMFMGHSQLAASFTVGASLMLGNLVAIAWSSWCMLNKKPIASTVLIIVIKYALLLGSVFYFARMAWFDSVSAGLGIASFILAVLGSALFSKLVIKKEAPDDFDMDPKA